MIDLQSCPLHIAVTQARKSLSIGPRNHLRPQARLQKGWLGCLCCCGQWHPRALQIMQSIRGYRLAFGNFVLVLTSKETRSKRNTAVKYRKFSSVLLKRGGPQAMKTWCGLPSLPLTVFKRCWGGLTERSCVCMIDGDTGSRLMTRCHVRNQFGM